MTLRLKLSVLLAGVAAVTVLLAWGIAGRAVLAPFAHQVLDAYLDQAVYVAERVAQGDDPEALGERLGLDIKVREQGIKRGKRSCSEQEHRGHQLIVCRGARAPVSIETNAGWVTLRRDLDPQSPRERIGLLLLLLLVVVIAASLSIAVVATKPLKATTEAMAKVAGGDLEHRLDEGAGELGDAGRAFNRMTARVKAMLETERGLMAGISHELRTPLARLALEVEMLRDRGVPETRVAAMGRDVEEMDRLIGELLETSRLSLGERTMKKEPLELTDLVHEALGRAELGDREVKLTGTARTIAGDRERLVRALANVLSNARKHAPEGPLEIHLDGATVAVADRGPGVPEASLARLFEPFYRAPGGASTGLGLGLMIARQVVDLHGGTITARNREGGGLMVVMALEPA